jgi:hypothetical protein
MKSLLLALSVLVVQSPALAQAPDGGGAATEVVHVGKNGVSINLSTGSKDRVDLDDDLPKDMLDKLSPEQLTTVLLARTKTPHDSTGGLVPLYPFVFAAFVVAAALYYASRRNAQQHETLRLMVEKGREIPPELLIPPPKKRSDLRKGLVLLAIGVGLMAFFALHESHDKGLWGLGLIPTLMGAGYLLASRLEPNGAKPPSA